MRKGTVRKIIFILSAFVFIFSGTIVIKHHIEMKTGAEQADRIADMAVTKVTESNDAFPGNAPVKVDFEVLLEENSDIVGWIYCPDTPLNYPLVQGEDNEYYLYHMLDGSRNSNGTVFLDYRNNNDFSDWNSLIYGHNMNNDSMFGSLVDYKKQSYFDAHPVIFLITPEKNYVIEIMSGFTVPADDELYNAFLPDSIEKARLLDSWLDKSDFYSGIIPDEKDIFVTLSTCSNDFNDARYVITGILKEYSTNH